MFNNFVIQVSYNGKEIDDIIKCLNEGNSGIAKQKKTSFESFNACGLVGMKN